MQGYSAGMRIGTTLAHRGATPNFLGGLNLSLHLDPHTPTPFPYHLETLIAQL